MMKKNMKTIFIALLFFGTTFVSMAQKYAYIDSDFILNSLPEYDEAKNELDMFAQKWQQEIEERYNQLNKRRQDFIRVEAILPDEEKKKRLEEIELFESETLELQQLRFGVNGDLFKKRKELIEPIQDKVFDALTKVASNGKYSFVFDKANQSNLIFADSKFDLSKKVLSELGVSK
jgi:outer membrane protein